MLESTFKVIVEGLSPRMRGHLWRGPWGRWSNRSIPADAGPPDGSFGCAIGGWVYPRGCGGTQMSSSSGSRAKGLSPRMRGHRLVQPKYCRGPGSIPADAGAPRHRRRGGCIRTVYPRGCGGTWISRALNDSSKGLSPRMRGHRRRRLDRLSGKGSIPADAGAPRRSSRPCTRRRVYPRGCGGTAPTRRSRTPGQGLSPRMRGHPPKTGQARRPRRSIPADAGAPTSPSAVESPIEVYPRGCGGTNGS